MKIIKIKEQKMQNPIIKKEDLKSGKLAQIIAFYMLNTDNCRKQFLESRQDLPTFSADYLELLGYEVSTELKEFAEYFVALTEQHDDIREAWNLYDNLDYKGSANITLALKEAQKNTLFNSWSWLFPMLTGVEMAGMNGCGDQCAYTYLPNQIGTTDFFEYDHETGSLDGTHWYSIADFISDEWNETYDDDTDDDIGKHTAKALKAIKSFNADYEARSGQQPFYHNPKVLFKRTNWIHGHASGNPTYAYIKKMSDAPTFDDWLKEKALIKDEPVLANYWILAHFYLGNKNSFNEVLELAKDSKSLLTRQLVGFYKTVRDNPKSKDFGEFDLVKSHKIIAETRKNVPLPLLEPEQKKIIQQERGIKEVKTLLPEEFNNKVASGTDPLQIIEKYPDDIDTHILALEIIAQQDDSFVKPLKYFKKLKNQDAYQEWYNFWKPYDHRLDIPVISAFRAGLTYDEDSKNSNAGLTRTLAFIDDDRVIDLYREAFRKLSHKDERIKYILKNIRISKHDSKDQLLFDSTMEILDKIKDSNPSEIEEMKGRNAYYPSVVNQALYLAPEYALIIVEKIVGNKMLLNFMLNNLGNLFRVIGENRLEEYTELLYKYLQDALENGSSDYYSIMEASIALTILNPDAAQEIVPTLFNSTPKMQKYSTSDDTRRAQLTMKSSNLSAMLLLNPKDKDLLNLQRRFLDNIYEERLHGALRSVEVTANQSYEDLLFDIYWSFDRTFDNSYYSSSQIAKRLLIDFGSVESDFPAFDDTDEYAKEIALEELYTAFDQPNKYSKSYICKRIIKEEYQDSNLINPLIKYLKKGIAYSEDSFRSRFDHRTVYQALALQGKGIQEELAKFIHLEYMEKSYIDKIIFLMKIVEPEIDIISYLTNSSDTDILKQFKNPEPRFIPWLDLLAARVSLIKTDEAYKAIDNSLEDFIYKSNEAVFNILKVYKYLGTGFEERFSKIKKWAEENKYQCRVNHEQIREYAPKISSFDIISTLKVELAREYNERHDSILISGKKNTITITSRSKEEYNDLIEIKNNTNKKASISCKDESDFKDKMKMILDMYQLVGYKKTK